MLSRPLNLVLEDRVVLGIVSLDGEVIDRVDIVDDQPAADADYLLPGLVDIHTDNVEHHFLPRPGVTWPAAIPAILAHDWQMLGAGITTVFDALSFGDFESGGVRSGIIATTIEALDGAADDGLLRVDHFLHFRCELSDPALEPLLHRHGDSRRLGLVSLMDHTPGQRQWHDLELYRRYRGKKRGVIWSDADFAAYVEERRAIQQQWVPPHREAVRRFAEARALSIASHDDTSPADIDQSLADGASISEFPTTLPAAELATRCGMQVVMGGPNVVLGGSHSGNVGAAELADAGLLHILTSDYVPASLLHAPFILAARGMPLPRAVATVTANPADAVGLRDRGRIAPGQRADLLQVALMRGTPVIRDIRVRGERPL